MKIKFRQHLCILAVMLFIAAHNLSAQTTESQEDHIDLEPYSMTPDQLDNSLRIDKHDLDLDSALHIDADSAIELLESPNESFADRSPKSSEFNAMRSNGTATGKNLLQKNR